MKRELTPSQNERFCFLLVNSVDNKITRDEQMEFERFLTLSEELFNMVRTLATCCATDISENQPLPAIIQPERAD